MKPKPDSGGAPVAEKGWREIVGPSKLSRPEDIRLRELILHIARQSEGDEYFGAVKLNKLLFHIDFTAYVKFGEPVTGQEYFALEHGPAPRRLVPVLESMKANGEAAVREHDFHEHSQQRTFALREADLSGFTSEQIALVDHVIRDCRNRSGSGLSEESHEFIGWKVAERGETIPYSVALVCRREPTKTEQEEAERLAATLRGA